MVAEIPLKEFLVLTFDKLPIWAVVILMCIYLLLAFVFRAWQSRENKLSEAIDRVVKVAEGLSNMDRTIGRIDNRTERQSSTMQGIMEILRLIALRS